MKINVYGLGEHGINRVKSPIHVKDGELLSAQNATIRPIQAQLSLTKRDGMAKINSSAAAGAIIAIKNIPLTSVPGSSWTSSSTGLTINMRAVAWSPALGMFVAVGPNAASGNAIRSTDGITWTAMTIASGREQRDIIWDATNARFVAAGDDNGSGQGSISYSTDGINWTTPTSFVFGGQIRLITYSSDLNQYVTANATNTDSVVYYGTDATNWTASNTLPLIFTLVNFSDLTWGSAANTYVLIYGDVGGSSQCATSSDGITWTGQTTGNSSAWRAVYWSSTHSLFVAVASSIFTGTSQVMTSPDGVTWTAQTAANANEWYDVTGTSTGRLIAVARTNGSGNQVMISDDAGVTWTAVAAAANRTWQGVAYSPELNMFVAVAGNGDPMYSV